MKKIKIEEIENYNDVETNLKDLKNILHDYNYNKSKFNSYKELKINILLRLIKDLETIKHEIKNDHLKMKWKYSALVIDRFYFILSFFYLIITFSSIILPITNFYRPK